MLVFKKNNTFEKQSFHDMAPRTSNTILRKEIQIYDRKADGVWAKMQIY